MRIAAFLGTACVVGLLLAACTGEDPVIGNHPEDGDGGTGGSGLRCDGTTACANGAPCVDGFCCSSTCTGVCEACNVAGKEGTCSPATGAPVHGTCTGDANGPCAGSCDGQTGASCTYPTAACGAGSCAAGTATLPAMCRAGSCAVADTQACALGCFEETCLGVKHLAAGYYHACAVLTDGKVRCWGANTNGEAGVNDITMVAMAPREVTGLAGATMVAASFGTTCVLLGDGTVKCFGSNVGGQLGNGTTDNARHSEPTLVPGLTGAVFLAGSSGGHFCAITTGGGMKCWGNNGSGQLGDGSTTQRLTPVTVCSPDGTGACPPMTGATFVAGGDNHTCAVLAGGKVACWGGNESGQLGQPLATTSSPRALYVTPALTATYLTGGNRASCAATTDGAAKCWGTNGFGVLGNGNTTASNSPAPVEVCTKADCSTKLGSVTGVATFDESACALAGGAVRCWGTNTGGQLGDGNASSSQAYAATTAIAAGGVLVTSGGGANYAIVVDRANRDVRCWGSEGSSQCGTGAASQDRRTPVAPKW